MKMGEMKLMDGEYLIKQIEMEEDMRSMEEKKI